MANYLVTGAAGFIGRSIAAALLARGETVRGIDNFITGKRANLVGLEAMEFMEGDLADPAACARACAGIEIVFHEAALASVPRSVADPAATNLNCVDATLNLLVAARGAGVRRVVYAGSSSVYGDTPVSAQARRDAAPPDLTLCRSQAGLRALHGQFHAGLRAGDSDTALLQRIRAASGSDFALLRRAGHLLPPDAGRGTAYHLRRRRTEPRLYLHRRTWSTPTCWLPLPRRKRFRAA